MKFTGSRDHLHIIDEIYTTNLNEWDGNFTSDALDDTEWWALAWIDAYDLTGNQKYLDMAAFDADYISQYVDNVCGGGVWYDHVALLFSSILYVDFLLDPGGVLTEHIRTQSPTRCGSICYKI
jgi:hypothetical protein